MNKGCWSEDVVIHRGKGVLFENMKPVGCEVGYVGGGANCFRKMGQGGIT